jgi:hypothetical protein
VVSVADFLFACEGFLRSSLDPERRALPIFDCRLPIVDGLRKELPASFSIHNQQSAMKAQRSVAAKGCAVPPVAIFFFRSEDFSSCQPCLCVLRVEKRLDTDVTEMLLSNIVCKD